MPYALGQLTLKADVSMHAYLQDRPATPQYPEPHNVKAVQGVTRAFRGC